MSSPNEQLPELQLEDFMRTARDASGVLIEGENTPNARIRRENSMPLSGLALEHQSSDDALALTPLPPDSNEHL